MTETDAEFVERIIASDGWPDHPFEIDRIFTILRRGAAVQWRPIEEAPKDGKEVLSIFTDFVGPYYSLVNWSDSYGWVGENGIVKPTHFMLLPPPPAGEKE